MRLTFSIDTEFLTISVLNFTFVNIDTPSAIFPESRRTLTMIRPVRVDALATRAKLIVFIAFVHVQAFVHFRPEFHARRTLAALIRDPLTAWSANRSVRDLSDLGAVRSRNFNICLVLEATAVDRDRLVDPWL